MVLLVTLVIASLGIGAIGAAIVHMIRNRRSVPVWAYQTDRSGQFGNR